MTPSRKQRRLKATRRGILAALEKAAAVVEGRDHFKDDFEARTTLALARLGRSLFARPKTKPKTLTPYERACTDPAIIARVKTPAGQLLLKRLEFLQNKRNDIRQQRLEAIEAGRNPDDVSTEIIYPPELHISTLKGESRE